MLNVKSSFLSSNLSTETLPKPTPSIRQQGGSNPFQARASYRVHILWLNFIGDQSMVDLEHLYRIYHDEKKFFSIKKFCLLLTLIFFGYLFQTVERHPAQFDIMHSCFF